MNREAKLILGGTIALMVGIGLWITCRDLTEPMVSDSDARDASTILRVIFENHSGTVEPVVVEVLKGRPGSPAIGSVPPYPHPSEAKAGQEFIMIYASSISGEKLRSMSATENGKFIDGSMSLSDFRRKIADPR